MLDVLRRQPHSNDAEHWIDHFAAAVSFFDSIRSSTMLLLGSSRPRNLPILTEV